MSTDSLQSLRAERDLLWPEVEAQEMANEIMELQGRLGALVEPLAVVSPSPPIEPPGRGSSASRDTSPSSPGTRVQ